MITSADESGGASGRRPHVTCLDCGREFWYDWQRMRRGRERRPAVLFPESPDRAA